MENNQFCQSCSMPLDRPELAGTEKDGTKSKEYCLYCYQNGAFLNPDMTLDEMKTIVKDQMDKRKIDSSIITMALGSLPHLKRWRTKEAHLS
jgi:radical SAM superfamily enzyme